jgi:hypothetical protein
MIKLFWTKWIVSWSLSRLRWASRSIALKTVMMPLTVRAAAHCARVGQSAEEAAVVGGFS